MVGNQFTNAGLVLSGVDDVTMRKQKMRENELSLADLEQTAQDKSALRSAVSGAKGGMYGALTAEAEQAKRTGNTARYQQSMTQLQALGQQAMLDLASAATYGIPPEQAEKKHAEYYGEGNIQPGSIEYGSEPAQLPDGRPNPKAGQHIVRFIDAHTGKPVMLNATQLMQSTMKREKLGAGEKIVQGSQVVAENPAQARPVIIPKGGMAYDPASRRTIRNNADGTAGGPDVKGNLSVLKEISQSVYSMPGMSEYDPESGDTVPTEAGRTASVLAAQVYFGSKGSIPPDQAAMIASNGTPVRSKDGRKGVQYNGKVYPRVDANAEQLPQMAAAPTPSGQPAPEVTSQAAPQAQVKSNKERFDAINSQVKSAVQKQYENKGGLTGTGMNLYDWFAKTYPDYQ